MEYADEIKNRLKRIEGQTRGVLRMMDDNKNCKDVVSQLSAIRNAVDRTIAYIVASNMEQCIIQEMESGGDTDKVVKEAINLLVKSR
ncbi:MAG: metal-sensitive transcriptional regulator [Bacillaceae bacterium]|nr:metal-sensitive transcriptional regulator [Bacillaceae bacterium]